MYEKKIERLTNKEIGFADLSENNDVIVETAGFVPLEVKLKRFEQNGLIAQFNESEFTSSDLKDIYLNPDFEISPEDDFEEVQEKLIAQQNYINELKSKIKGASSDQKEKAGTQEQKVVETKPDIDEQ